MMASDCIRLQPKVHHEVHGFSPSHEDGVVLLRVVSDHECHGVILVMDVVMLVTLGEFEVRGS